jgi:hypothetical protein
MSDTDDQPTLNGAADTTVGTAPDATPEVAEEKPAPREIPDGYVLVRLITALGEGDIIVPPRNKWRSLARNRLVQNDDLGWAVGTLSDIDILTWVDLDPDQDEVEDFFTRYNELAPADNRAARRAKQRGTHLRAAS